MQALCIIPRQIKIKIQNGLIKIKNLIGEKDIYIYPSNYRKQNVICVILEVLKKLFENLRRLR